MLLQVVPIRASRPSSTPSSAARTSFTPAPSPCVSIPLRTSSPFLLVYTSPPPPWLTPTPTQGRTRQLNFFRSTPSNIILVDAPGYGARGRASWGELFQEYVLERKELKRVYVLFNGKHHLNEFDVGMVEWLSGVQWEVSAVSSDSPASPSISIFF